MGSGGQFYLGGIKKDLQVTLTLGLENQGPVCQASREQRI